jgi:predicted naringenin-chalcone synthase
MKPAITAIGTANPSYQRSQTNIPDLIATAFGLSPAETRLLKSIYKKTGIETRYSVLKDYIKQPGEFEFFPNDAITDFPSTSARMNIYKENALPLALMAIDDCLAMLNGFNKNDITHLITISCTGMYAPGIDIEIIQHLKLNSYTERTAINFMGCYGTFNGLKVANAICLANPRAKVLIVSVELCTLHFQKSMSHDNMIANAIFADGAGALLVQANPETDKHLYLDTFYCDLLPQTSKQMAWHIADSGFDITLSSYVPEAIKSGITGFVDKLLAQKNMPIASIDFYAIHPGGIKILEACEESLNITQEQNSHSYQVLKQYGNMSSATIIFVLKEIWNAMNSEDHHKNIFSCAFGPGLTLESMLLKMHCRLG